MNTKLVSDESRQLFVAARQGDDSALWRLTEQLRPYLKALVTKELGSDFVGKVDDSDVVQQSMIRAANKFSDFHGEDVEGWQAWLVAIARNEARNTIRYWRQQRRDVFRDVNGRQIELQGRSIQDESTPSKAAIQREDAAELLMMIGQLSDSQQQIIHWRYFDNLSHHEIAERLGISENASRQRAHKALLKLNDLSGAGDEP